MAQRAPSRRRSLDSLINEVWDSSVAPRTSERDPACRAAPSMPDACLVLDIARLGLARGRNRRVRILGALDDQSALRFSLAVMGGEVGIVCSGPQARGRLFEQVISLTSTRSFGNGDRFWLTCACGRRATKLYLPPGASGFGCADCLGLQVGHEPGAALRWRGRVLRKATLDWTERLSAAV